MKKLKRSLMVVMALVVVSSTSHAGGDCETNCKNALNAADKVIADLKDEVNTYKQLTDKQHEGIINLHLALDEKSHELESLFRNPYFMATLGIIVGGGLVLYLTK